MKTAAVLIAVISSTLAWATAIAADTWPTLHNDYQRSGHTSAVAVEMQAENMGTESFPSTQSLSSIIQQLP